MAERLLPKQKVAGSNPVYRSENMKLNRFFVDFNPLNKNLKIKEKAFIHQIKNVLRLKKNDKIILFRGDLKEFFCKIIKIERNFVELEIEEIKDNLKEPEREISLYIAILKKENFELVVQKATEIGVKEIIPLITERTVKKDLNLSRLNKIAKEASEQSERALIPKIFEPVEFKKALDLAKESFNLFCDLEGDYFDFETIKNRKKIGLFIGPEGGWSENEKQIAKENGFHFVKLSLLTFRAETAAIIGSYLVLYKKS